MTLKVVPTAVCPLHNIYSMSRGYEFVYVKKKGANSSHAYLGLLDKGCFIACLQ